MRNEIAELRYEMEKAQEYINDLLKQISETEKIKDDYRDQVISLQFQKEKMKEVKMMNYPYYEQKQYTLKEELSRLNEEKHGNDPPQKPKLTKDSITLIEDYSGDGSGHRTSRSYV